MKDLELNIASILSGQSPLKYFDAKNGYLDSIAIDPDFPVAETGKPSGVLRPVAYEKFSGANINGNVIAEITNPKNALVYAVLSNGRLISYNSSLASEALVGTVAGGNAEGATYYNNYIYIFGTGASKNDISRYGPLNNSPSLVDAVWTGATLGSQTALVDTTYPSIRGAGTLPNHWGFFDIYYSRLLVCDYKDGEGMIHYIKTTKTTNEGDTNDSSVYSVLTNKLPFGYMPTCMGNWGQDIVIGAIQTSNTTLSQGNAALFFWDGTSEAVYRQIHLPDPIVSAILSNNGSMYIWSGKFSSNGGYSLYRYIGGEMVSEIASFSEGHPPLQGAVDALGDKVVWGSWVTTPANAAVVWGYGSIDRNLPQSLHCIARATAAATASDGVITALKFAEQGTLPKMILGWREGTIVCDSYSESNQSTNPGLDQYWDKIGQSFTGNGKVLSSCKFFLKKEGSPTGNAVATIYAHSGTWGESGKPTGSPLATSDNFDVSTLTTDYALTELTFTGANKITLTNGTHYIVMIEYSNGDGSNKVKVGADNSSPTHDGNLSYHHTPGWSYISSYDCCFYVYVDGEYGLDKLSTTYQTSYFRKMFNIGNEFNIKKIHLNLGKAIGANMTITPKIYIDDESSSKTLRVINNTNWTQGEREVSFDTPGVQGKSNFILELKFSGSSLLPILLPIRITVQLYA